MAAQNSIITRQSAKESGAKLYFTGKPCKNGHVTNRITSNGYCLECSRLATRTYRENNPDRFAQSQALSKAKRKKHREESQIVQQARKALEKSPSLAALHADRKARADALAAGRAAYQSARTCKAGHTGLRFSKSYACVTCYRQSLKPEPPEVSAERAARRAHSKLRAEAKAKVTANRDAAIAAGLKQFMGSPCPLGHSGLRWVASYNCVECGRIEARVANKSEYDKEYRKRNPEKVMARVKAWVKSNPDKRKAIIFAYDSRRRSQVRQGDSTATIREWIVGTKKVCHWCGAACESNYHVDHYAPLSKGGKHEVANMVIACPSCNLRKNAKDPYTFAAEVGRLF